MTLHISRPPISLDPLIAEAKRRMRRRQVLVAVPFLIAAAAGAAFVLGSSGGSPSAGGSPARKVATFSVKSVNSSTLLAGTYVTIVSPVVLSRHTLARTPLFNVTAQFSLVKRAHGPRICSFTKKIERSVTFPNANGKTVRVEVNGSKAPARIGSVCRAFKTFSLSYLRQPALAGAGGGLGGFQAISAAQHPRTKADRLDPSVLASIAFDNKQPRPHHIRVGLLSPDSSRFLKQLANGERVYAVAATGGAICALVERLRIPHAYNLTKPASDWGCSRLTRQVPTTIESFKANPESPVFSWGIALDGVTAVSWMAGRQGVITVPVRHNAWVHLGNASFKDFTVHFADGRTEKIP